MITIDRATPYRPARGPSATQAIGQTPLVENDSPGTSVTTPVEDRRKNRDRRRQQNSILLESRSGKDRRKNANTRKKSIDIKA